MQAGDIRPLVCRVELPCVCLVVESPTHQDVGPDWDLGVLEDGDLVILEDLDIVQQRGSHKGVCGMIYSREIQIIWIFFENSVFSGTSMHSNVNIW